MGKFEYITDEQIAVVNELCKDAKNKDAIFALCLEGGNQVAKGLTRSYNKALAATAVMCYAAIGAGVFLGLKAGELIAHRTDKKRGN